MNQKISGLLNFEIKIAWWPDRFIKRFFKKKKTKMNKTLVEIALAEYGAKEILGSQHNMDIVTYAKYSGFDWVNDDETPWCSIFLNYVALKSKMERTKKANARSWLDVGIEVNHPETSDIVIFKRGNSDWQGHVGIFINQEDDFIRVLGGNQGNEVNISTYNAKKVLGFRRLRKA